MPTNNKTLQVFWVALGALSSIALGFVSVIVLSRYLGKDELGTFRQISFVYTSLAIFFTIGLPSVYAYYLPRYSYENGVSIINKIKLALVMLGIIFSITLYISAPLIGKILNNPALTEGLRVFSIAPAFIISSMGLEGILAANKNARLIAVHAFTTKSISLACILVPVVIFNGGYIHAVYGWVVSSIISFIVTFVFERMPYRNVRNERTTLSYKEILQYSIPLGLAGIWGVGLRSADHFYISRYFGPGEYAEYSLGMIEIPFVGMITAATSTVLMPIFSKMIHQECNLDEILTIWRSALIKSAGLIYPIVIFCIIYADQILTIMYTDKYVYAARYFSIGLILNFFNIIVFSPLILAMGKVKVYSLAHIIAFVVTWILGLISASYLHSALGVAFSAVLIKIALVMFFMWYIAFKFNARIKDVFPIFKLTSIAILMTSIAILAKLIVRVTGDSENMELVLKAFPIYIGILLITAPLLGINYLRMVKPLMFALRQKIKGQAL